jgi:hypothetical protein
VVSRKTIVVVAGAVAALLVVGALVWALAGGGGGGSGGVGSGGGEPGARPTAGPSTTSASSPPGPGSVPDARTSSKGRTGTGGGGAGGDAMAGFLNELGAIDPGLVGDPGKAMRAGQSTCQDLTANKPYDEVVREAVARFKTPTVAIDKAKATLIVDAARNHLCPG